jgi:bifunctional DNA-binding transcriptional regulator/antitoxin component of YhaV-PrlF toxin-antitoxin module
MRVTVPKELLKKLDAKPADYVAATQVGDSIDLKPHHPDFEAQMAVAREVTERRNLALRELAK